MLAFATLVVLILDFNKSKK
ncbi:hypothetical protein [Listeria innocua]